MPSVLLASHTHLEDEIRDAVAAVDASIEAELLEAAEAALTSKPLLAKIRTMLLRVVTGLALFLLVGNLLILGTSMVLGQAGAATPNVKGVKNLRVLDGQLWRGAAPTAEGYRSLAAAGVTTVIDLRHDDEIHVPHAVAEEAGLKVVRIPVRDGQTPGRGLVDEFLAAVKGADGLAFVHCGAGVGRTGAMSAAYLESTGQAGGLERVEKNLSVGPPSLEQIVYAATVDDGEYHRPNVAVVMASRVLDAPRRIWHNLI